MTYYITYCCLFPQRYIQETMCSIRSIFAYPVQNNFEILILTDQTDQVIRELRKLPIQVQRKVIIDTINTETIAEWKNIYRNDILIKLLSAEYYFKKYRSNLLIFCGNTFMLKSIDWIFDTIDREELVFRIEADVWRSKIENPHHENNILETSDTFSFDSNFIMDLFFVSDVVGMNITNRALVRKMICTLKKRPLLETLDNHDSCKKFLVRLANETVYCTNAAK